MLRLMSKIPGLRLALSANKLERDISQTIREVNLEHLLELGREQEHETTLLSIGLLPYFLSYNMLPSSERKEIRGDFNTSVKCIAYGLLGGDIINEVKDKRWLSVKEKEKLEESGEWAVEKAETLASKLGVKETFQQASHYSMVYENWEDKQMEMLQKGRISETLRNLIENYNLEKEKDVIRTIDFESGDPDNFSPQTMAQLSYRRIGSLYHATFKIGNRSWLKDTSLREYAEGTERLSKTLSTSLMIMYDDGEDLKEDWIKRKPTPLIILSMRDAIKKDGKDFSVEYFFGNPAEYRSSLKKGINDVYALSKGYIAQREDVNLLGIFKDALRFKFKGRLKKGYNKAKNNLVEVVS